MAATLVAEILDYWAEHHNFEGANEPSRILFICYELLRAVDDSRAEAILHAVYRQIKEQADNIAEENRRRSFLENVQWNRSIVSLIAESARHGADGLGLA